MSRTLCEIITSAEEPSAEEQVTADRILAEYYSERNAQVAAKYVQCEAWSGWMLQQILHQVFTVDELRANHAYALAMSKLSSVFVSSYLKSVWGS